MNHFNQKGTFSPFALIGAEQVDDGLGCSKAEGILGHQSSTYARRARGVKQKLKPCVQRGGGLTYLSAHEKKFLSACTLLYFHMQSTFIILCCLW